MSNGEADAEDGQRAVEEEEGYRRQMDLLCLI